MEKETKSEGIKVGSDKGTYVYKTEDYLGCGGLGQTYIGKNTKDSSLVVIKKVPYPDEDRNFIIENFEDEDEVP